MKLQIFMIQIFRNFLIPKVDSNHTCLAVVSLDAAIKKYKNYYPKVFFKECKCIKKNAFWHINDNLSSFSSSDYTDDSDEEQSKALRENAEFLLANECKIYTEVSQESLYKLIK